MKSIPKSIFILIAATVILTSCSKTETYIYDGPVFVSFTDGTSEKYALEPINEPLRIQVGIPYPLETDLVIELEVESATLVEGTHFDVPSSVTITKNNVIASFTIQGYFEMLEGIKDTVTIKLKGEDVAEFNNSYAVYLLQKEVCPLNIPDVFGDWIANEVSAYDGPFDPYLVTFEENPNGGDTVVTDDLWPYYPVKIAFDTTSASYPTWNIPEQYLYDHSEYGPVYIASVDFAPFNSCDLIMETIRYQIYVEDGFFEDSNLEFVKIIE